MPKVFRPRWLAQSTAFKTLGLLPEPLMAKPHVGVLNRSDARWLRKFVGEARGGRQEHCRHMRDVISIRVFGHLKTGAIRRLVSSVHHCGVAKSES